MSRRIIAGITASLFLLSCQTAWAKECNVGKVEKAIKEVDAAAGACAVATPSLFIDCEGASLGAGTPACVVAFVVIEGACLVLGVGLHNRAHALAGDICDYANAIDKEKTPFVVVQNKLKEHRVDFRVVVKHGDDVHQRGPDWLDPGRTGILLSNKLETKESYTVKARIKRDGKKDVELEIDGVKPDKHVVSVEYENGDYTIKKEKKELRGQTAAK